MRNPSSMVLLLSYLSGLITAILILFLFAAYKIGFSDLIHKLRRVLVPSSQRTLSLPQDILEELTKREAVIGNADYPTKRDKYNTILIRPDSELQYVLRPDVELSVSTLRSNLPLNFDPPVLELRTNDSKLSSELDKYIKEQSRLNYKYSTDKNGFRKTVPYIESDKQLLLIGASIPFGVGVDDESTTASYLQKMIGKQCKIVNASVGGYYTRQIFLMAKNLSEKKRFAGLIYVASQHDFMYSEAMRRFSKGPRPVAKDWVAEAAKIFKDIKSISDRFDSKVCIVFHTYLEYNLVDLFLKKGLSDEMIEKTRALQAALPEMTKELGFDYCDWSEIVIDFMKKEKSIMSRFALYADHCHSSPLGNRLMAEKIFSTIMDKWLIEESTLSN